MSAVYRAFSILVTSGSQLPLGVERGGQVLADKDTPSLIRRPSLDCSRRQFVSQAITSLAASGNLYLLPTVADGQTVNVTVLDPREVLPARDPKTRAVRYHYQGKEYRPDQLIHRALLTLPGHLVGLGPIQAAQVELGGARDMRDYAAGWFTDTGLPTGILTTDLPATSNELRANVMAWNYLDENGQPVDQSHNPARIRALGKGLRFQHLMINPKDAQWIEARQFVTTDIARIFGIPASLMLAATEGTSMTYTNVEQEWIGFIRFTLTAYLAAIEDALTECVPRGQTVRFNIEGILRSDTKTRYEAHEMAIRMGLYSADYARSIESLPAHAAPAKDPAA